VNCNFLLDFTYVCLVSVLFGAVFCFNEYFVYLGLCTGFMFVSLNISVAVLIWLPFCVVKSQELEN